MIHIERFFTALFVTVIFTIIGAGLAYIPAAFMEGGFALSEISQGVVRIFAGCGCAFGLMVGIMAAAQTKAK